SPQLSTHNLKDFFYHVFTRIQLPRDLLILTGTTIDTLDYSSKVLNFGSKAVFVCAGPVCRQLSTQVPEQLTGVTDTAVVMPGVVAITLPHQTGDLDHQDNLLSLAINSLNENLWQNIVLIVVCDQANVVSQSMADFVWHCFTKSDPCHDLHGKNQRYEGKRWLFDGPLFIDARSKRHHGPVLKPCPDSERRVDQIIAQNPQLSSLFDQKGAKK
ncbi:MAG: 3-octaprenyl-4-hydroxybenzoate carboxy-lyase, partial [Proteobacteria bacterium]|nr:3-octaprenyl-4-hydroxybenzoate carboxy-lyase [Pseudomonadota bacterium]